MKRGLQKEKRTKINTRLEPNSLRKAAEQTLGQKQTIVTPQSDANKAFKTATELIIVTGKDVIVFTPTFVGVYFYG